MKHKQNEFESKLFVNVDCCLILNTEISSAILWMRHLIVVLFQLNWSLWSLSEERYTIQNWFLSFTSPLLSFMFVPLVNILSFLKLSANTEQQALTQRGFQT